MKDNSYLTIKEAAYRLRVSTKTLRRWEERGIISPFRTKGGQRRYIVDQLDSIVVKPQTTFHPPALIFHKGIYFLGLVLAGFILGSFLFFSRYTKDNKKIVQEQKNSPMEGLVLGAQTENPNFVFNVNVPAQFSENAVFTKNLELQGELIAPNVINTITGGTGITVAGTKSSPTVTNAGVLSLGGSTGALTLTAGTGISVSGLTISSSLTSGDGISISGSTITNSDRGTSQKIFKTVSVSGQNDVVAGSNTDTLTFVNGTGITLTTDSTNKKLTIAGVAGDLNVSGWTDDGTVVRLATSTDSVGIGTNNPSYTLDVSGTGRFTGNVLIGGGLTVNGAATITSGINNQGGGVTNAGAITGGTGFTSSGTITLSGLSTGLVHSNASGVLSSSAVNLASSDVTGTLPVSSGGTNLTAYTTGNMIYASATNTLTTLGIGGAGQVLTVSGGIPAWGTINTTEPCPTCLINNPGTTQTITPSAADATGLVIKQASSGSVDVFKITDSTGGTSYFRVDSSGNVLLGSGQTTSGILTVSPANTDPLAFSPVAQGSNAFTGTFTSLDLTGTRTWTFPNATGNVCLDTGNCAGSGSNLGGSGTANYLTRWNAQYVLENSSVFDNGNIGIGTTNPTTKLYVSGTGTITGVTTLGSTLGVTGATTLSSTLGVTGATILSDTLNVTGATTLSSTLGVTGLITGNGNLTITGNGNSSIAGNLGIGTTAPANKLDVSGGMVVGSYAGTNTAPSNGLLVSGNVGIGTTNPAAALQVIGNLFPSSSASNLLGSSSYPWGNVWGSTYNIYGGNETIADNWGMVISGNSTHPIKIASTSLLVGYTSSGGSFNSGDLLVNGNVGIGTTSPGSKLDITKTVTAASGTTKLLGLNITDTTSSTGGYDGIYGLINPSTGTGTGTKDWLQLQRVIGGLNYDTVAIDQYGGTTITQRDSSGGALGTGADGSITVSSTKTIDTDTMISGRSCADGGDAVNYRSTANTAAASTTIVLSSTPSSGCLAAGDEVLIINLRGTSDNYANVGQYETHYISSISTATLTLDSALTNGYDGTTQDIVVQRIPQYANVTVNNGGTITATAYSTSTHKNGIVFFRATGNVVVNSGGTITVAGKGYPGASSARTGGITYNGTGGTGASTNGGNGSSGQGGGGGAGGGSDTGNGGAGAIGGAGGGGGAAAGFDANGGSGGYGTVGSGGSPGSSNGSGTSGGNGGNVSSYWYSGGGGGGGTYGTANLSTLFFGSGGGVGRSGSGGNGGGIVYFSASNLTVNGTLSSNGSTGTTNGGDGAGGSVFIKSITQTLGSSLVTASGGGSSGGSGRIRLDYTTISGTVSPSAGSTNTFPTSTPATSLLVNRNDSYGKLINLQTAGTNTFTVDSVGDLTLTSLDGTGNPVTITANSLTSGNLFSLSSTSLTSGNVFNITTTQTTGNVFTATSSAATTGNMLSFSEGGTSNFSGNGLFFDFGRDTQNGWGAGFTGNFLKFNNGSVTDFLVDAAGKIGTLFGSIYDATKQINGQGFSVSNYGQTAPPATHPCPFPPFPPVVPLPSEPFVGFEPGYVPLAPPLPTPE